MCRELLGKGALARMESGWRAVELGGGWGEFGERLGGHQKSAAAVAFKSQSNQN